MSDQIRKKRIFYINSENALSSSSSTFSVPLQIPDYIEYNRITVLQACVPISYYLIQAGLNTFQLKEDSTTATVTIPPGNYNINSFAVVVSPLLNAASPNSLTYTITYNNSFTQAVNGLYTFSVNSSAHTISFIFSSKNTVNESFGFSSGVTVVFTPGSGSSSLVSTNVCQFIPENTIYIHSNLVNSEYTDVLQEVYNQNNPPFSYISFTNPDPLAYSKALNGKAQQATFSFSNESNIPLYFNGANLSLTIMIYRDNDFYQKAEGYIRYKMIQEKNNAIE